jgi:hypothetical protein
MGSVSDVVVDIAVVVLGDVVADIVPVVLGSVPVPVSSELPSSPGHAVRGRRSRTVKVVARTPRRYHRGPSHHTSTRVNLRLRANTRKDREREQHLDRRGWRPRARRVRGPRSTDSSRFATRDVPFACARENEASWGGGFRATRSPSVR